MTHKDEWYLERSAKPSLRKWAFQQMAMGAVYAAILFFGIIAVLLILAAIGRLLPEDPFAVLDAGRAALRAFT